jgi:hypothetical protein
MPDTQPGRIEPRLSATETPSHVLAEQESYQPAANANQVDFYGFAVTSCSAAGLTLEDISDNEGK